MTKQSKDKEFNRNLTIQELVPNVSSLMVEQNNDNISSHCNITITRKTLPDN